MGLATASPVSVQLSASAGLGLAAPGKGAPLGGSAESPPPRLCVRLPSRAPLLPIVSLFGEKPPYLPLWAAIPTPWQRDGVSRRQLAPAAALFFFAFSCCCWALFSCFFFFSLFPLLPPPSCSRNIPSAIRGGRAGRGTRAVVTRGCVRRKRPLPAAADRVPRSPGADGELMFPTAHPGSSDPLRGGHPRGKKAPSGAMQSVSRGAAIPHL